MAKVLVVDDSNYARRVHGRILENNGHTVLEQSTGMGAIETFSLENPDLVLLDLSMEDLGGIDVLKTIRQLDPEARVIVISADVQKTTEQRAMDAGASKFIGKPANEQTLLSAVAELVT
jgi:two-component system, chemotaxis family, chemotaxis protein CheY